MIVLGNGFLACLSDFWINPLLALIILVLTGRSTTIQTITFIMAAVILAFTASVITWQNQIAFKTAQASNVIPAAQVPIQISPVVVYFFIFALTPPRAISVFLILAGMLLTIIAGFLLGRRLETPPVRCPDHPGNHVQFCVSGRGWRLYPSLLCRLGG